MPVSVTLPIVNPSSLVTPRTLSGRRQSQDVHRQAAAEPGDDCAGSDSGPQ